MGSNSGFSSSDSDVCDFAAGGAATVAARLANPVRTASLLFMTVGVNKRHPRRLARTNSQIEGIVLPAGRLLSGPDLSAVLTWTRGSVRKVPLCFWGGVALRVERYTPKAAIKTFYH